MNRWVSLRIYPIPSVVERSKVCSSSSQVRPNGRTSYVERRLQRGRTYLIPFATTPTTPPQDQPPHVTRRYSTKSTTLQDVAAPLFSSLLFSKEPDKLRTFDEKCVRVNRRQCKADDTVVQSMSKPRGSGPRSKNKINHLNPP